MIAFKVKSTVTYPNYQRLSEMISDRSIQESWQSKSEELEKQTPLERIEWAGQTFGNQLVMTTSFGIQSALMLHLATKVIPDIPVIFIDTGYLFPETYQFAEALKERFNLNLKTFTSKMTAAHQEAKYGKRWEDGPKGLEAYNLDNKVEPMNRALKELGAKAWLSGLRRVQSKSRKDLQIIDQQNKTVKIHPVLEMSERDVYYYFQKHDLPFHPLWDQGYVSVGDWHSTVPLEEGMSAEETRFGGEKRECGLHEVSGNADWQI